MTPFTCVVIGNESLLIGCAEAALARGHSIAAVVSTDADIQAWAAAQALPCHADPVEIEVAFDWLFSIANLRVIPEAVLGRAGRGAINFHDGPLPAYAGLNTPNWALIRGETRHGITWHMLEGGIDEGDIIAQRLFDIAADDTAYSLNSKCYAAALESFSEVLDQVESGTPERQPQDLSQRSYFAKADRPAAGARLDFNRRAADIARLVRALDFGGYWNPLCAPKLATLTGQLVLVGTARAEATAEDGAQNHPGQVLGVSKTEVQIATADGVLVLSDLRLPMGGKVTPAQYFATGDALPLLTEDEAEALTAALAATQAAEPHWRQVLTDLQPVQVPLARAEASGNMVPLSINVPATLSEPDQLVAVLAWALLSDGADKVDLAVTTPELAAAAIPGLIADWAPLGLNRTARLSEVRYQLADWQDRIRRRGGFACDLPARDPQISRIDMPRIGLSIGQQSPLPGCLITVAVCEGTFTLHVDEAALSETARDLLAARLQHLLTQVAAAGDLALQDIDALPQTEKQLLLTSWNTTAREYHKGLTIPAAFEAQVARTPEVTALVFEDQSYSYSALNARANAVADRLHDMGVTRGSTVGVYVRRSPDLVVATLAIMKAGGAYVPMDPAYPADRIAHYLQDSQAHVVITQSDLKPGLPTSDAAVLVLDGMVPAEVSRPNVDCGIGASDLAYLIYTSGSTGTPKGVMVSHGNVANFFAGMDDRIPHHVGDTWLAVTSLSFDISVLELFWTLSRGFKLVLSSDESRLQLSNGPIAMSDRRMDFNLFYWGNDDGPGPRKYHLLLEGAKFADANGFNAVWTPERHFHAFGGPYPNPSVTGAAVAAVTNNLSVRAGSCVAPLHHPARVAEEWSVIDNLTNGRAGIGIASGWQPDDFILRPENTPPANKPAMYETIDILRRLWRGEEVEFPRQDGTPHAVITQPRPVSRELPVWVTTAGNPDTWREAGEIGANVLTHLLGQSIAEVGDKIRIYRDALRGAGHDPDKFTVTLMLHTYLADSREEARRIAREPMKDYLRSAAGLIKQYAWAFPAFKRPKGVNNPFEMQLDILSPEELEAILDFAFERYFEDSGLFGTVQDGVKRTEELKRIGVDEIACLIDYGIAPDVVLKGLEPLAEVLRLSNAPTELAKDDFSLAAQMVRHQVSHMQCTPSMARMISQNEEALMAVGRLQHLLVGGEALPGDLVAALRAGSTAQIHNMYGPTETTIWSTVQTLDGIPQGIADIGTPIANTTVYVLDTSGRPAPVGVAGELFIGGEGVAAGYWQRAELTAERFVADPHGTNGARMYRTGDLARWRSDGRLDFLGRTDHQVKIRGQRIELGEIEAAVAAYPGVTAAVVVPRMVGAVEQLVAYVTAAGTVDDAAVKDHLSRRLAEVMVPAHVVRLEQFPLTPNKKIDRKALPDPTPARAATTPASQPPAGGVQTRIAAVWSRILGIEGIAAQDNFFALGGHSLLAVQAHRDIRQDIGVTQLSITDIFRFPTLSGLADHIEGLTGSSDAETAAPPAPEDTAARTDRMSKRREMRANRKARTG